MHYTCASKTMLASQLKKEAAPFETAPVVCQNAIITINCKSVSVYFQLEISVVTSGVALYAQR
jgi:hypothetical protein